MGMTGMTSPRARAHDPMGPSNFGTASRAAHPASATRRRAAPPRGQRRRGEGGGGRGGRLRMREPASLPQ
eukprot:6115002-Alexandrium_andersonii.AAC.1